MYINEKQAAILESLIRRVSANLMERPNKHFKIGKTRDHTEILRGKNRILVAVKK